MHAAAWAKTLPTSEGARVPPRTHGYGTPRLDTHPPFVSIYSYSPEAVPRLTDGILMSPKRNGAQKRPPGAGLFALLQPYRRLVTVLVILTLSGNALSLAVPKLI